MKDCSRTSTGVLEHEFEKTEYHKQFRLPWLAPPPYRRVRNLP